VRTWQTTLEVRRITRSPVLVFRKDELVIGWGEGGDFAVLTADDRHAVLHVDDGGEAWITPVSERGTWIDGRQLTGPTRFDLDAQLTVAERRLEIGESIVSLAAAPTRSPAVHSRWQLEIQQAEADPPQTHVFARPRIAIGAGGTSDLLLPGEDVASPHCELRIDAEGRVEVADLGSQLGTCIDGRALAAPAPLSPGAELGVAEYVIRLVEPPRALEVPSWQLTFDIQARGGEKETRVFRKDQIWIGRTSVNDIALGTGNCSRRHCFVAVRPDGVAVVVDGQSTNGTWLNGRKVTPSAPMRPGDSIYVGNYSITLARDPERLG
jgi:pSer/pThr/pTyr-binding forkhead associated (FHA) protein